MEQFHDLIFTKKEKLRAEEVIIPSQLLSPFVVNESNVNLSSLWFGGNMCKSKHDLLFFFLVLFSQADLS